MGKDRTLEIIKTEIERLKAKYRKDMHKSNYEGFASGYKIEAYNELLSVLSTLESEKPMSQEELEEEIDRVWKQCNPIDEGMGVESTYMHIEAFNIVARHFYDLGCHRTAEKYDEIEYNRQRAEESVPNDLEEAAIQYATHKKKSEEKEMETELPMGAYYLAKDSFTAGAKWQENKVQETIKLAEDHAFLAGADWQKEHTPLPEDTVLFNKGVKEGKRLMMEEAVEGEVESFSDMHPEISIPLNPTMFKVGDKVRVIILPKDD